MKWFIDGDQIAVTKDNFSNLQESPAVFIPRNSKAGEIIEEGGGIISLPISDLQAIKELLESGGGEYWSPIPLWQRF